MYTCSHLSRDCFPVCTSKCGTSPGLSHLYPLVLISTCLMKKVPHFFSGKFLYLFFFLLRILLLTESKIAKLLTRDCGGEHVYSFLRITIESHAHLLPHRSATLEEGPPREPCLLNKLSCTPNSVWPPQNDKENDCSLRES